MKKRSNKPLLLFLIILFGFLVLLFIAKQGDGLLAFGFESPTATTFPAISTSTNIPPTTAPSTAADDGDGRVNICFEDGVYKVSDENGDLIDTFQFGDPGFEAVREMYGGNPFSFSSESNVGIRAAGPLIPVCANFLRSEFFRRVGTALTIAEVADLASRTDNERFNKLYLDAFGECFGVDPLLTEFKFVWQNQGDLLFGGTRPTDPRLVMQLLFALQNQSANTGVGTFTDVDGNTLRANPSRCQEVFRAMQQGTGDYSEFRQLLSGLGGAYSDVDEMVFVNGLSFGDFEEMLNERIAELDNYRRDIERVRTALNHLLEQLENIEARLAQDRSRDLLSQHFNLSYKADAISQILEALESTLAEAASQGVFGSVVTPTGFEGGYIPVSSFLGLSSHDLYMEVLDLASGERHPLGSSIDWTDLRPVRLVEDYGSGQGLYEYEILSAGDYNARFDENTRILVSPYPLPLIDIPEEVSNPSTSPRFIFSSYDSSTGLFRFRNQSSGVSLATRNPIISPIRDPISGERVDWAWYIDPNFTPAFYFIMSARRLDPFGPNEFEVKYLSTINGEIRTVRTALYRRPDQSNGDQNYFVYTIGSTGVQAFSNSFIGAPVRTE